MPRKISIPSTQYAAGTVIQRTLDQFNPQTNTLLAQFTREGWPGTPDDTVMRVTLAWNTGGGGAAGFPGGTVLDRQGNVSTRSMFAVDVPEVADAQGNPARRNVVSGVATLEVFQTLTTAITLEAL